MKCFEYSSEVTKLKLLKLEIKEVLKLILKKIQRRTKHGIVRFLISSRKKELQSLGD